MLPALFIPYALLCAAKATARTSFTVWDTPVEPLLPSKDRFYTEKPQHLSSYAPGDLIRVRTAPGNLTAMFNASSVYNIVYRTEDSLGNPLWSFTTLLSPEKPYSHNGTLHRPNSRGEHGRAKGTALLSYQAAYNTPDVDWSESVLMYDPAQTASMVDASAAIARGWFVTIPDHEGPYAAFGAGSLEGKSVLDGVRAVYALASAGDLHSLKPLELDAVEARFALWGYSGGSIASSWAGSVQSFYAPDLSSRFAGLVIGGMAVDLAGTENILDGTPYAAVIPLALLGLTQQFPASRQYLVSRLKPKKASQFLAAEKMSFFEAFAAFANQSIYAYFQNGQDDLNVPLLTALGDGHFDMRRKGVPAVPVFAYKAIGDDFSPVAFSDELINDWCKSGANVLYERNTAGAHISEFQNGHSRSLAWLDSLYNGTYTSMYDAKGCVVKNVTVVDPTGPPL